MAEHKHGEMDVTDHEKIFDGFMSFSTRSAVAITIILVLMAIFIT